MYGPPSRDFFCNVGLEATSLERAARGEAVRRTDSKDVVLVSDHEGHHFVWDRDIDEAAPRLQCTESSSSSNEAEDDESSTLQEEPITRAEERRTKFCSHVLTIQGPRSQHAIDSLLADFLQWSGE